MGTEGFDPVQYRAGARREWDSVASGWRKWWPTIERRGVHCSRTLLDMAGVKEGHRVLDIATGTGEPAVTAAGLVGPSGSVTAIDQSPEMLAVARDRAVASQLSNISFMVMNADAIDLPENGFDAALCRWGLMFMPDLPGVMARVHRVLAPGGRFSAAVWGQAPKVPMVSVAFGAIRRLLNPPPPAPGTPSMFSLAEPGLLEKVFARAGFTDVRTERLTVAMEFESPDGYVDFLKDVAAPVSAIVNKEPRAVQDQVWRAVAEAARERLGPGGTVRMENETICVVGTRPA
ncbi:MAG: class I SAM-dependent methyltransferase [Deltaproteobacteria bacterium]|nr:class I SAM-dependent methyltransferase [Deltaproteobacteria bacterium]